MSTTFHAGTSRNTHASAILGNEFQSRIANAKVLVVGAGGIGCELLKNVVMTGFGDVTLIDMDIIDLSNLNRQFLFRKKDVKQSKCTVAARVARSFNPSVKIHAEHNNIKSPQFDIAFFRSFDIVLNALDNLDARRHVNKMCLAAGTPLVESGTAGYLGQVQPIVKERTECFDCMPKATPKTFPVCTIRSTPTQPIHCIVWAKDYLLSQLFSQDPDVEKELDEAEKQGENAKEIENLRKEAQAFSAVRKALKHSENANGRPLPSTSIDPAQVIFEKVYNSDIKNLLSMSDMWKNRLPPTPLDYEKIASGSFSLDSSSSTNNHHDPIHANGTKNGHRQATSDVTVNPVALKDQRNLSLQECLLLFISSIHRLAGRHSDNITFDKDDDDTLDFVTAASNLRAAAYGIPMKTRWEVKEMAGNIIPAIATTNAIIAGIIVLQALQILRKSYDRLRFVHLQRKPEVPLNACAVGPPSKTCGICRDTYVEVFCDPSRTSLSEFVQGLLGSGDGNGIGARDISVYENNRILLDPDFDDNADRSLESLGVGRAKFLTIVDEEGEFETIVAGISNLPESHPINSPPVIFPTPLPIPPLRRKVTPSPMATSPERLALDAVVDDVEIIVGTRTKQVVSSDNALRKRGAEELDGDIEIVPSKRAKQDSSQIAALSSPSKRQRLEEDGLLMLDNPGERLDEDSGPIIVDD